MLTHYEILGVGKDATPEEIKKAYRTMSKKHHPDLNGTGSTALFSAVNEAYQVLGDESSRGSYDYNLAHDTGGTNQNQNNSPPDNDEHYEKKKHKSSNQRREFIYNGFAQTEVDWESFPWYRNTYDGIKERINNYGKFVYKRAAYTTLFITLNIMLIPLYIFTSPGADTPFWKFTVFAIQVVAMVRFLQIRNWDISKFFITAQSIFTLLLIINIFKFRENSGIGIVWVIAIFAAVALFLGIKANIHSRRAEAETSRVVIRFKKSKKEIINAFSWGEAGNLEDALEKFGRANIDKGMAGEKYTEHLLNFFGTVPGIRLFNGLSFPGSAVADVDHAIISGNNLVFVDSKQWSGGAYWWENDGSIGQTSLKGGHIARSTNFHAAVSRYRKMLPERVNIYSVILMHGTDITVEDPTSPYDKFLYMANTQDGIELIGNILTHHTTGEIDYPVVNSLINSIK